LAVDPAAGTARVTREIDDGVAVVEVPLPAVVTAQQGLAEPRYPNVRAIMQSKKKPVTVWALADLGVEAADAGAEASRTRVLRYRAKPARQGGRIVEGETVPEAVAATVELLAIEAKVW
ncbi:electron transfer flavoprotein subunit beta/FixA family protein, partial [Eggerthella sinensis]